MQGRLLPKYLGRYQAHPVEYWEQEFAIAKGLGLSFIEFILDANDIEKNPLMSADGVSRIQQQIELSCVQVTSVCADCFMQMPLHDSDDYNKVEALAWFERLLVAAEALSIRDIVIPCVDNSSLLSEVAFDSFAEMLQSLKLQAEEAKVNLSLETDLPPARFSRLLEIADSDRVTVNYDIGNSAALGYDYRDELAAYGEKISDLHVKDRVRGGGPVVLGTGDADIPGFFQCFKRFDYHGPVILQAYRDEEGIAILKQQFDWLKAQLDRIA